MIEPQDLAFAEAHMKVLPVPYTPAELKTIAENIRHELEEIGVSRGASVGLGGRSVGVIFDGNATEAECEAAIPILAKYGSEVTYSRTEGVPIAGVGQVGPLPSPTPPGSSKEPSKHQTAPNAPSQPTIDDARNGNDALLAVIHRLDHPSSQRLMPIKARMRLALSQTGRLLIRLWATSGSTRKLIAVGATPVQAGDREIVVLIKRTGLGRRLRGKKLHRIAGDIRLLSNRGDAKLAQMNLTH